MAQAERVLLDNKGAAKYLHASEGYLNKGRCYGYGPPFLRVGKKILYDRADLDTWLDSRRRTSTSDTGRAA